MHAGVIIYLCGWYTPSRAMDATRLSCEYYPRLARKENEDGEVDAVYAHPEGSPIFQNSQASGQKGTMGRRLRGQASWFVVLRSMRTHHASITERARRKKPIIYLLPRFGVYCIQSLPDD